MTWDEVAIDCHTDKASVLYGGGEGHGYMAAYERYLPHDPTAVLELGVDQGASLRLWDRLFPRADIYGVDLHDRERDVPDRTTVLVGDCSDPGFIEPMARQLGPFDIVVDDASHVPAQVARSFATLFGHVVPGGIYAIEDLYWPDAIPLLATRLVHQKIERVVLTPDRISRDRNVLGPLLIIIEKQA